MDGLRWRPDRCPDDGRVVRPLLQRVSPEKPTVSCGGRAVSKSIIW